MSLAKMIGEQIRHYRNLRGLTQEQLAEILESHGTYIGRLERGEQNVQLATLEKIAEALHISVFAFFNHDQFEHLKNQEWIWRTVLLLQEKAEIDQQRAYRVLKEMFTT
ncbi:helix-turn-helix domain-containing protein [Paenibacillus ehimensis]|uniref:Helix-turn-helix transcriptional regulator n=1 Tax=Paenibacillus ehimensis TaxID=79264 RepID=A0ABT8VM13_9BACL|nr:helix-turn-helix transcriptional regulator [Paenibacillus ehimensis]MDO3682015.1 helix-turn-helix transcriptional regulator [Paenibacillus ehimensis]